MSDSQYLDAVARGDMKTAQRMVDAAAEAAGYGTEKLYHGNETGPFKSIERPLFLSTSRNEAKAYSEETDIEAFTKQTLIPMEKSEVQFPSRMDLMKSWPIASDFVGKPFTPQATADGELFYWDGTTNAYGDNNIVFINNRVADDSGKVVSGKPSVQESVGPSVTPFIGTYYVGGKLLPVRDSRFAEPGHPSAVNVIATRLGGDRGLTEKWSMLLKRGGYSGIDTFSDDGLERGIRVRNVVMFDPTQIKSADPVTYDDAGQVIPLSRRFNSESPDIRNPYTRPDLRDRLKRKIMAGSKGGNPGQWSARKAQLLAAEYERAGGGYSGKRSASQRSLSKWTKQDWRTKSGKPSLKTGERYLPAAAITALTSAEYAETSRAKRKATGQFSRQPKRIAMKTSEYRNPMTNAVRKKLAPVIEPDDRILCYDTASGEDFYRLWDIIHTAMPMTKEALVEVEGMLDDDGVLVIESGESPAGLQDHFRKATRYNGLLLVQGPKNPEEARIETEKLRRELE
jgi:hypothetical protein